MLEIKHSLYHFYFFKSFLSLKPNSSYKCSTIVLVNGSHLSEFIVIYNVRNLLCDFMFAIKNLALSQSLLRLLSCHGVCILWGEDERGGRDRPVCVRSMARQQALKDAAHLSLF